MFALISNIPRTCRTSGLSTTQSSVLPVLGSLGLYLTLDHQPPLTSRRRRQSDSSTCSLTSPKGRIASHNARRSRGTESRTPGTACSSVASSNDGGTTRLADAVGEGTGVCARDEGEDGDAGDEEGRGRESHFG